MKCDNCLYSYNDTKICRWKLLSVNSILNNMLCNIKCFALR